MMMTDAVLLLNGEQGLERKSSTDSDDLAMDRCVLVNLVDGA
jgi:hypothetical protein